MRASEPRSSAAVRHGAYLCLTIPPGGRLARASVGVSALAERLGLHDEFASDGDHPSRAIAFLRRVDVRPGDIADDGLAQADAIVHIAAPLAEPVATFCAELARLLGLPVEPRVLGGVVRPARYTGDEMHNYAYAHRVLQQPGAAMPHAFLLPLSKTAAWWDKGWMERHSYFLPRYDDAGRMLSRGHALAAEPGIASLMRRTYKQAVEPAPEGAYDFVNYFECADEHVATFHEVCAALRDRRSNPEWQFVREGPTWHGRRVATWAELIAE